MKRLLQYFAPENSRRLQRDAAIFLGFAGQLIATMLVGICAMGRKYPDQGLCVLISIAASFWLQVTIALLFRFEGKVWPTKLIFSTAMISIAVGSTLVLRGRLIFEFQAWLVFFEWLGAAFVVIFSLVETLKYDFGISIPQRRQF